MDIQLFLTGLIIGMTIGSALTILLFTNWSGTNE